ncbi:hypothetical protein JXA70_03535 [candidate division KSB1 bacterium]|nr:hypothetical protein [candidate division KSB1 bacterium]
MKILVQGIVLLALLHNVLSNDMPGARPAISFDKVGRHFAEPDMLYAPFVFWFWDRPIDNPETKNRIKEMARTMIQHGLNPGYVHARFNMVGEPDLPFDQWLSGDWFRAFEMALSETKERNAYLGYVDEFWWPSGRAAGRVLEKCPDMWAESLHWETIDVAGGESVLVPEAFFVIAAQLAENGNGGKEQGTRGLNSGNHIVKPGVASREIQSRQAGTDAFLLEALALRRMEQSQLAARDSLEMIPHTPARIYSESLRLIGSGERLTWCAPDSGAWRIYLFHKYYHPGCDGGRLNYLDQRLSDAFIQEAHAPYADHLQNQLGSRIPGVFVDHEGDYGYKLAWSNDVAVHYQQKFHRDIRLWLPLLVDEDVEGRFVVARWQWFDAVSDVYVQFFQGTAEWCAQHGLYSISNLWEESLMWQASAVGDFFKAQRAFSMPGTDALGLRVLEPHDFMETKSVCEFENRRMQSEIMGAAGFWGFDNITIKKAANAAITWGVSHVVPHAIWLTRKLDGNPWLPDWYEENPWWPQMSLWSDFIRRASYVNSHGHAAADVLLLNPMDSVWGLCGPGVFDPAYKGRVPGPAKYPLQTDADIFRTPDKVKEQSAWWCPPKMDDWYSPEVQRINKIYSQAIENLIKYRIEFLIADRHYMRQMQICDGELTREPFRFKSVILPAMKIIPHDVAQKVLDFAQQGGHVYVLESWPVGSTDDGLFDPQLESTIEQLKCYPNVTLCDSSLRTELKKRPPHLCTHLDFIFGEFDMLQHHRIIDGHHFFWLANNTGHPQTCALRSGEFIYLQKWNCEQGLIEPLDIRHSPAGTAVELNFDPYEAFWLVASDSIASPQRDTPIDTITISTPWRVKIETTNQPPVEHRGGIPEDWVNNGVQELTDWHEWGLEHFSGVVTYATEIELPVAKASTCLDLGEVHVAASLKINGQPAGQRLWPPYTFDITSFCKPGLNSIQIDIANLLNNSYGDSRSAGLLGPVRMIRSGDE